MIDKHLIQAKQWYEDKKEGTDFRGMFKGGVAEKFQDELDDEMEQIKLINMIKEQEIIKHGKSTEGIKKGLSQKFGSFMKKNSIDENQDSDDSLNSPRQRKLNPKNANFMAGLK